MRVLGLDLTGRVPDARTIWLFRGLLTRAWAINVLFASFDGHIRYRGYRRTLSLGRHRLT